MDFNPMDQESNREDKTLFERIFGTKEEAAKGITPFQAPGEEGELAPDKATHALIKELEQKLARLFREKKFNSSTNRDEINLAISDVLQRRNSRIKEFNFTQDLNGMVHVDMKFETITRQAMIETHYAVVVSKEEMDLRKDIAAPAEEPKEKPRGLESGIKLRRTI